MLNMLKYAFKKKFGFVLIKINCSLNLDAFYGLIKYINGFYKSLKWIE
jgi:hypothetical protein